jgi:hypothetical protein
MVGSFCILVVEMGKRMSHEQAKSKIEDEGVVDVLIYK